MNVERELGIDRLDLPHGFETDSREGTRAGVCRCGRSLEHDLHSPTPVQEQAAYSAPMVTEKGS